MRKEFGLDQNDIDSVIDFFFPRTAFPCQFIGTIIGQLDRYPFIN